MKRGLEAFTSAEVAALRISIAFLALAPLMVKHYKIDLKQHAKGLLMMGVFGNLLPAFLFTAAETRISSSLAGMLNALTPLFTIVIAMVWTGFRPTKNQTMGVLTGLVAAVALMWFEGGASSGDNFMYGGLIVIATVFYAISVNAIRKYLFDVKPVTASVWSFTFIGSGTLSWVVFGSHVQQTLTTNPEAWSALGFVSILAVVGTASAVVMYNYLIRLSGAVFASSCTYLIPVVAVMWGVVDGEAVNFWQLVAIGGIIGSVWMIHRK
jgi:drug/metabolite transporter (DMT)-like permease